MTKEQLSTLGIDEETAKKVLDINGKDIEGAKASLTAKVSELENERDGLAVQLQAATDSLATLGDVDPASIKAELETAQKALKEAQDNHAAEMARRDSRAETEKLLASHKFINDITREHYISAVEAALEDKANKGKSRQDIFTALTQEDGRPKAGIFLDENPNRLPDMPPAGGFQADKPVGEMTYTELAAYMEANPSIKI